MLCIDVRNITQRIIFKKKVKIKLTHLKLNYNKKILGLIRGLV